MPHSREWAVLFTYIQGRTRTQGPPRVKIKETRCDPTVWRKERSGQRRRLEDDRKAWRGFLRTWRKGKKKCGCVDKMRSNLHRRSITNPSYALPYLALYSGEGANCDMTKESEAPKYAIWYCISMKALEATLYYPESYPWRPLLDCLDKSLDFFFILRVVQIIEIFRERSTRGDSRI
jgi:hypothetical protein